MNKWTFLALVMAPLLAGCSLKRIAVNKLGDALARGGTSFATDDDPDLVRDAAPFSLKLMESLLAESPRHRGLLQAAASGYTQYTYAFVQQQAAMLEEKDLEAATAARLRARRLYLRARDYGLRGLEVDHRGWEKALRSDAKAAVGGLRAAEVPLMYWTAAAWAAAITLSKDQPEVVADLPLVEALIDRALDLDEKFEAGAIHTFLISYEMSRPGGNTEAETRSRRHFERAVLLSQGRQAGPYVALAEAVALANQNRSEFESLLRQALAVNADAQPEWRLVNLIMQRRAQWLLSRSEDLFLPALPPETLSPTNPRP